MFKPSQTQAQPTAAKTETGVPFYANHEDTMRSTLAVYRMVIRHFLHKELSWDQLADLAGYEVGKEIWPVKALTNLVNRYHISAQSIKPFNYKRYASEGHEYLYDLYDNEEVEWLLANTNIDTITPSITKFLATVRPEDRRASLEDIDTMLANGQLVSVSLNSNRLNGKAGFVGHSILIIGLDGNNYVAHDPGPPPVADRRISRDELWQAMGGDSNVSEVTGFKNRRSGLRLDQYVIQKKPSISRSYAVRLIDEGSVLVNGKRNKPGFKLRETDKVIINFDEANLPKLPEVDLPVLYEDDDCVAINKPAGVLTHSKGTRNDEGTVASWLRERINQSFIDKTAHPALNRAGIVHRLDRVTSGVMVCAKTPAALAWFQKQFHDRTAKKTYIAIIKGHLKLEAAVIDMPIERNPKAPATFRVGANGKSAVTQYKVIATSPHYSLLELKPQTGRTHQLRVHLAEQGHPIVGDVLYKGEPADRLYLHARELTLNLPNDTLKTFEASLPAEFNDFMGRDSG